MNKKTQTGNTQQTQQQTNTYGWQAPPITAETQGVINEANKPAAIDPAINGYFGNVSNQIKNSYNDPFGGFTTQGTKDKSLRANMLRVGAEKGKAQSSAYFDANNQKFAQKTTAASLTAPQMVQTGGTSSGNSTNNTTQAGGFWGAMIPSVISGAAA